MGLVGWIQYDEGTTLEIIASPSEHWIFNGWQGDHSGNQNPASIVMDSDKSITAQFIKREYPLTINIEGEGSVQEEVIQQKTTDYPHGTIVQLTANPAEGWVFIEWSGDLEGDENPQTIIIQKETNITAVFEQIEYTIDLNLDGNGEINISPNKNSYVFGEEIIITVEPEIGWNFVHWKGDVEGTDNPLQLNIDQSINATAVLDNSPFEGGNGSEEYPYMVSTVEQLQEIKNYTNKYFVQINDIDASETEFWNDGAGFIPIGNEFIKFTGVFDGGNFAINQMSINQATDFVGLFGQIEDGVIKNLSITNSNVQGNNYTGVLTGRNNGEIINSYVEGIVNGSYYTGGLVGNNLGLIKNSGADVNVSGAWVIGGLVGNNQRDINFSYSIGKVIANGRVGGLAGWNSGNINESFAKGNVTATSSFGHAGGLIGQNRASVMKSYSQGDVEGTEVIGGLVGLSEFSSSIEASYSHGNVTGNNKIGGLIGINADNSKAIESFSTGKVIGNDDIGGLVGINGASIESCYWDSDSSEMSEGTGQGLSNGITSKTTVQMTGDAAKNNMPEFDWENIWETTTNYPILRWQR